MTILRRMPRHGSMAHFLLSRVMAVLKRHTAGRAAGHVLKAPRAPGRASIQAFLLWALVPLCLFSRLYSQDDTYRISVKSSISSALVIADAGHAARPKSTPCLPITGDLPTNAWRLPASPGQDFSYPDSPEGHPHTSIVAEQRARGPPLSRA